MNGNPRELEKFKRYAFHRADAYYYCRRTALELIDECERIGMPILGIDGAFLTDTQTHQPIEWILDLPACPTDYDAARRFIESGASLPLFYEIVLGDIPTGRPG
jgi:hypothetical protein